MILPRFMELGDYLLSNNLIIERKCVKTGDLLESLKNGRLNKQLKSLLKTFKTVIILIEYSDDIPFTLQAPCNSTFWKRY